jgi:hypothetical protein
MYIQTCSDQPRLKPVDAVVVEDRRSEVDTCLLQAGLCEASGVDSCALHRLQGAKLRGWLEAEAEAEQRHKWITRTRTECRPVTGHTRFERMVTALMEQMPAEYFANTNNHHGSSGGTPTRPRRLRRWPPP